VSQATSMGRFDEQRNQTIFGTVITAKLPREHVAHGFEQNEITADAATTKRPSLLKERGWDTSKNTGSLPACPMGGGQLRGEIINRTTLSWTGSCQSRGGPHGLYLAFHPWRC
jgi:hypothetical protein